MSFRFKAAFRYAFSKIRGQRTAAVMITLGIAAGIIAMIMVSSIMNGLQGAQIDRLRNLESYDIVLENTVLTPGQLEQIAGVDKAFVYGETAVLITDKDSLKSLSVRLRAFSPETLRYKRLAENLTFSDSLDDGGLCLSTHIMSSLRFLRGDSIEVTFLRQGKKAAVVPYTAEINVDSAYVSTLSSFSSSTALMGLDRYVEIMGNKDIYTGIYCSTSVSKTAELIREADPQAVITQWPEYNRTIYSALMLEKAMVYVFLSFIFLIICVNLRNSTGRLIDARRQEGAMLRALGATRKDINIIFMSQGIILCTAGEILGALIGLLAVNNIQNILVLVDAVAGTSIASYRFEAFISAGETCAILAGVLLTATLFTFLGCRRTFRSEIMEVIFNVSD